MRRELTTTINAAPLLREVLIVERATRQRCLIGMGVRVVMHISLVRIITGYGAQPLPGRSRERFHDLLIPVAGSS